MTAPSNTASLESVPAAQPWPDRVLVGSFNTLVAVLVYVPHAMLRLFASFFIVLGRIFAKRERRLLATNLEKILGLRGHSHFGRMFETQVFRHQILCTLETLICSVDRKRLQIEGLEELKALVAEAERAGRGHILITAHLGSWEFCALYGSQAGQQPMRVLAKPPKQRGLRLALDQMRQRLGVSVFWTDRKTIVRDMLGALRQGECLGFVMDQKPEGRKGPMVEFFGQQTAFVGGPAAMTAKTGCPVISIFCVRLGPYRYRIESRKLLDAEHGQTDQQALTQLMATEIERVIRLYPEQWTWNYKRWRFE